MKNLIKQFLRKSGYNISKIPNNEIEINTLDKIKRFKGYPYLGILDTSIATGNLGDFIIMESINHELHEMFNNKAFFSTFPTHIQISGNDRNLMMYKELLFIGGTNLLNSNMLKIRLWKVSEEDISYLYKRCVLMGVGWGRYDKEPNEETTKFLKNILSDRFTHSVRDEYTKKILKSIGIENVINTCCPTTWRIKNNASLKEKALNVITTITDYNQNLEKDTWMLNYLLDKYEQVYIWIQSIEDLTYIDKMEINDPSRLIKIPPALTAYRNILSSENSFDYIGTRLHAGIYAMQHGVRTLIIAIDNRATEIGKDIGLNIVDRSDIKQIEKFINFETSNNISLPINDINTWKTQFKTLL